MFQLSSSVAEVGTTLRAFVCVAPHALVERFGPPRKPSGDGKVSGSYVFIDNAGGIVVVYDWKSTTLYSASSDANLPRACEFWLGQSPKEFSVSARGAVNLRRFAQWIGATHFRLEREVPSPSACAPNL